MIAQQAGVAVLILDNTGHAEGTRARGAVSKTALVEAAYTVTGGRTSPSRSTAR